MPNTEKNIVLEILPHKSFGPISLGINRKEVIEILGAPSHHSSAETRYGINFHEKDYYYNSSFQITYDENGKVEFIEAANDKYFSCILYSKNVFKTSWSDLIVLIEKNTNEKIIDEKKAFDPTFYSVDLGLYREDGISKYATSIGIGVINYYSK